MPRRNTASSFTWEQVLENLIQRLEYQAKIQGLIALPKIITSVGKGTDGFLTAFSPGRERELPSLVATDLIAKLNNNYWEDRLWV